MPGQGQRAPSGAGIASAHVRERPRSADLLLVLLAWVAGAACQLQQARLDTWALYLLATAASALACAWALRQRVRTRWPMCARVCLVLAVAVLSWAKVGLHARAQLQTLDPALEGVDLDLVGIVQAMPQQQGPGWRFLFRAERAELRGAPVQVPDAMYLGWYAGSARDEQALTALAVSPSAVPRAGERWRLRVRLKAAHGHLNPRGFDYELWLWEQGVAATGYVREGRHDPPPRRLEQTWRHPVEWWRQSVRETLLQRLAPSPAQPGSGPQVAGIVAALVTGDQAALDRSQWDVFRATGVSHLMSISGLHITLLAWLAAKLVTALWRMAARRGATFALRWPAVHAGLCCGVALACGYAVFSGWGIPAQRTVCMMLTAAVLRLSGRRWPSALLWSLAAAVVVTLDPWCLLQVGFWLSFVAVGVLWLTDPGREHGPSLSGDLSRHPDGAHQARAHHEGASDKGVPLSGARARLWRLAGQKLLGFMREQWVVTLALAPFGLLFFGQLSFTGLLANLVAIPWVTLWVTPLCLLGIVVPAAWSLAALSLQPLVMGLEWMATWPLGVYSAPMPPTALAVWALLGACLLLMRLPWSWRLWGLPMLLPALLWTPVRPPPGSFDLLVADVGQGNAVRVRTARHTLLYDTGPRYSPESDAGHRVLLPLLAQSAERLGLLVLSHRDTDHTGGAEAVLTQQPGAALLSSLEEGHPLRLQRPGQTCALGQRWVWDGVVFEILHPEALPATGPEPPATPNARSCVLRIATASASVLLAGDIEAPQERMLLARGLSPVDLLLVPHHGSKTSSSPAFVQTLRPRVAVAQAGYRNRFGHPVEAVRQRYESGGSLWIGTPACGAVHWRSEEPAAVQCERDRSARYWHHGQHP